ncbi:Kynurenine formamidase [Fusarium oxysporum f. sp. albedinis]|nr:Kynurenine formamidase [Fusarium oxysporum f. sp. albedinis]
MSLPASVVLGQCSGFQEHVQHMIWSELYVSIVDDRGSSLAADQDCVHELNIMDASGPPRAGHRSIQGSSPLLLVLAASTRSIFYRAKDQAPLPCISLP